MKLSLRVASRSDGIEAFMVKFTVSAAKLEAEVSNTYVAAARMDLVMEVISPFLKRQR